ncbi:MAG: flagellar hook-associated protein FlgK [Magnetovibrionaceae bacterium]
MVGDLTLALRTAQSGLLTNQAALDAVANNIANVNTEGYSRKVAQLEQRVVSGVGAGVQLSEVTRNVDEGLIKSMRESFGDLRQLDVQESYWQRIQQQFGLPDENTSIAHIISEFQAAIEGLAANPGDTFEQSEVVRQAIDLTQKLQDMSSEIQTLRQIADQEIADTVEIINARADEIASLNDDIVRNGAISADVTDLQDQRDLKINEIAELVDISYFYRDDGQVVIFTTGGRTIVDNENPGITHAAASTVVPTATHEGSGFSPIYVGEAQSFNDITDEVRGGALKGLIDLRDGTFPDLQYQIDELATELRDAVNQVHNRGTSFPGENSFSGTREFVDSSTSTITWGGTTDTRLVLTDSSGDQVATTTMRTLLGTNTGTVDAVATAIQTWIATTQGITGSTAAVTNGKLAINVNSTTQFLSFRDEDTASTEGSTLADATIQYNADAANSDRTGTTGMEEIVSGFSNFFGLNDFFVDSTSKSLWESDVISSTFTTTAATLSFTDNGGASLGSVAISAGLNRDEFVAAINNASIGVTAQAVPDADGYRIRISRDTGVPMEVLQGTGETLLTTLNLQKGIIGASSAIDVRSDIKTTPSNIATGQVQWDADLGVSGQYYTSVSDDSNATALAEVMNTNNQFDQTGGLGALNETFEEYGAAILARNANLAEKNETDTAIQLQLTQTLQNKSDTFRGVNLDEELSQLIIYEQAYSAAARVVNVIQSMFDALDRAVS